MQMAAQHEQKAKERAEDMQQAELLNQQIQQHKAAEKAAKAALQQQKLSMLQEQQRSMKAETKKRFVDYEGMVNPKDMFVHKKVLEGRCAAFNAL